MRTRTWTAALAALALTLAACGDDSDDEASTDAGAGPGAYDEGATTTAGEGGGAPAGGSDGGVTIEDFSFDPAELTVAAGATIAVQNAGSSSHTFTSEEGGFDVELGGGESGEATAPAQPGEYDFVCRFHSNMQGTLTVE